MNENLINITPVLFVCF